MLYILTLMPTIYSMAAVYVTSIFELVDLGFFYVLLGIYYIYFFLLIKKFSCIFGDITPHMSIGTYVVYYF